MRRFIRPGSARQSGSAFSASMPRPVGASHSSQARQSTISASRLATAALRVRATVEGRGEGIAGYDAIDECAVPPVRPAEGELAGTRGPAAADAAELALARDPSYAAPALPRGPPRPDREQP